MAKKEKAKGGASKASGAASTESSKGGSLGAGAIALIAIAVGFSFARPSAHRAKHGGIRWVAMVSPLLATGAAEKAGTVAATGLEACPAHGGGPGVPEHCGSRLGGDSEATHDLGVAPNAAKDSPMEDLGLQQPKTASLQENLEKLKAGDCDFGTREKPGQVLALDYSEMGAFKLPGGIRCPVIVSGLEKSNGWGQLAQWAGNLEELEKRTHGTVDWDQAPTGEFAYWDNNSLLSSFVRENSRARQGYLKVTGKKNKFFGLVTKQGKPFVRYGGRMNKFSSELSRVMEGWVTQHAPVGAQQDNTDALLWLSGPKSWSTAHFDSFHNFFAQLHGVKRITLAPPQDGYLFHLHPGTHPLARQSRRHFADAGEVSEKQKANAPDEGARILEVSIGPGSAVFIPAMWMHHVLAETVSVSLALTSLPFEHYDFNGWVGDFKVAAPFLGDGQGWTSERLISTISLFIPALLELLGFTDPTQPNDPLNVLVNRSYGIDTRKELGLSAKLPKYDCYPAPDKKDVTAAKKAAKVVAKKLKAYAPDIMAQYLTPYFETVISKAAGAEKHIPKIMQATVMFAQSCIHPIRMKRLAKLKAKKSAE